MFSSSISISVCDSSRLQFSWKNEEKTKPTGTFYNTTVPKCKSIIFMILILIMIAIKGNGYWLCVLDVGDTYDTINKSTITTTASTREIKPDELTTRSSRVDYDAGMKSWFSYGASSVEILHSYCSATVDSAG